MAIINLQQVEVVEILERVSADARDAVGVDEQQLERRQAVEDSGRKLADPVAVQNPARNGFNGRFSVQFSSN